MQELPITGYLDRFSCRPGEILEAKVSVRDSTSYRVRLLRMVSADANPAGPGVKSVDLSNIFERMIDGRHQTIRQGSYGFVPKTPVRSRPDAITWTALIFPTLVDVDDRAVLSEEEDDRAITLLAGQHGVAARISTASGSFSFATNVPLRPKAWYRVWVSADAETGRVVIGQKPLEGSGGGYAMAVETISAMRCPQTGVLLVGADTVAAPARHFNGKIQDPALLAGFCTDWLAPALAPLDRDPLAFWDFALGIGSELIHDVGPHGCHGRLVNLPTRAVTGADWSGREMCWRHEPQHYAAIHFHDDDLSDCRWSTDFHFTVPDDLQSGCYAFHLSGAQGEDWLPFYVLPKKGVPQSRLAVVVSTYTYVAYANYARGNADETYRARVKAWGAYPYNPDDYPVYAGGHYSTHSDGSGVVFSSRLRPILTMRPAFIALLDQRGSGLRHYPADSHLFAWLEAKGIAFDVLTDDDIDREGVSLLASYPAVFTGVHPEYQSLRTLEATQAYINGGGRFAYLGGNGFYWRVTTSTEVPGVLELRRAEGGIRAWAAEPGEYYHAFDGQYGGLWRRNGRPPQKLVGIGFSAQGAFEGVGYLRLPASRSPEFAWLFESIDEDVLGNYGLGGGGAAGFELDRADVNLGTSLQTTVLARSEPLPASFVLPFEELLTRTRTMTGEPPAQLLRGDMVYFENAGGGAVFSAGSITFCGSLWKDGTPEGPISRLVENLVCRFTESRSSPRLGQQGESVPRDWPGGPIERSRLG